MGRFSATETCTCGATFGLSSESNTYLQDGLTKWREGHHHTDPAPTELAELVSEPQRLIINVTVPGDVAAWPVWRIGHEPTATHAAVKHSSRSANDCGTRGPGDQVAGELVGVTCPLCIAKAVKNLQEGQRATGDGGARGDLDARG